MKKEELLQMTPVIIFRTGNSCYLNTFLTEHMKKRIDPSDAQAWPKSASVT